MVPLSKELNISCFGTPVGEEFYKSCLKLDEIHDNFYHFSCLKRSGTIALLYKYIYMKLTNCFILLAKNEIIKQVTFQEGVRDITATNNSDDQLSTIDKETPNSKNVRDKVRKCLQEKFGK